MSHLPASPALASQLAAVGHVTLPALYAPAEVRALLDCVENAPAASPNFRRSQDVFAIRNLLGEIPALGPLLATPALRGLLAAAVSSGLPPHQGHLF